MWECDFCEYLDGEPVIIRQEILTRKQRDKEAQEWVENEKPKGASIIADGRREVRSWEF